MSPVGSGPGPGLAVGVAADHGRCHGCRLSARPGDPRGLLRVDPRHRRRDRVVKIEEVELRRIRLALVTPFQTSFGTQTERDILLVRVAGPDAEGWGECIALSEPVYSSEYVDGAAHVIVHHMLPRLC